MMEATILREPGRREPKVLAVFSYRYDAHLVPGLIANLGPFVHGYVAWDDRAAGPALSPEPERRGRLLAEALRLGADWILAVDPDERFEDRLAWRMPEMLAQGPVNIWRFDLREMFAPDAYRADGLWGGKSLNRLFPARAADGVLTAPLHGEWFADAAGFGLRRAGINLYHLRMASPERRRLRRALYAAADPERRFQRIGYDYLDDERGMLLEAIPEGRGFSPVLVEDHGLWAPDPGAIGEVTPDPQPARLAFAARSARRRGSAAACHVLLDLWRASPDDDDLGHAAGALALTAGMFDAAEAIAGRLLARQEDDQHACELRAWARLHAGRPGAGEDLAALRRAAPDSPVTERLAAEIARPEADFSAPGADWRRWAAGPARCREGVAVPREAGLAAVVIGLGAPAGLAGAVASLRAQDQAAEIVVVNSGGGDPEAVLAEHLEAVRLIDVAARLYVGAARNIGVAASRAPVVAFLAGDCLALPGWVSGRLARHRAGALSVSTPVAAGGSGLLPLAINRLRYWARSPATDPAWVAHFGRSYARRLLLVAGAFPPGLRVSEDDALNCRADRVAAPVWAPEVRTAHRDPERLSELLRDNLARGRRRADHPPFRAMAGRPGWRRDLAREMRRWRRAGARALDAEPGLTRSRRAGAKLVQWLANRADRIGLGRALARLARADAALAKAESLAGSDPAAAAAAARRAARLDPQDWWKALRLGELLVPVGEAGGAAEAAFRRALALAPEAAAALAALTGRLRAAGAAAEALRAAERGAIEAPLTWQHWDLAAELALAAGEAGRALAHGRRALALAPDLPALHRNLAIVHRATGNPLLAELRELAARRLEAAEPGGAKARD